MTDDKIVNAGYVITQELRIYDANLVMGINPDLVGKKHTTPYVTWECDIHKKDFYWGHYFSDRYAAERDLVIRGMDKIRHFDRMSGLYKSPTERDER